MPLRLDIHHYHHHSIDESLNHFGTQLVRAIQEGFAHMGETFQETIDRLTMTVDTLGKDQLDTDEALVAEVEQIRKALQDASSGDQAAMQAAIQAQITRLDTMHTGLQDHKAKIQAIIPDDTQPLP
jgi:uncharacterized coiled-coil DUF342 family protein